MKISRTATIILSVYRESSEKKKVHNCFKSQEIIPNHLVLKCLKVILLELGKQMTK